MDLSCLPENPYILLTPGPLSTSKTVKAAMLRDWCTWDADYKELVQDIRARLVALATPEPGYTAVLMQGSGTFCVEATLGTALPAGGRLLVLANGHYGQRMARIAECLRIDHVLVDFGETQPPCAGLVAKTLAADPKISHVAVVHCETTTGMLNPVADIGRAVKDAGRVFIVDAMSSFGGMPMDLAALGADFLVSSANKCLEGVPGFGFVLARRQILESLAGRSRSLSLDLHDQWRVMEEQQGKWRFTSPTHTVRAFSQALAELEAEGGIAARHARYVENRRLLVTGMHDLGFRTLLPAAWQSPIITSFFSPEHPDYDFGRFYDGLKSRGFVIYPGKVSGADCFRIGTIGHVFPADIRRLLAAIRDSMYWPRA